MRAGLLRHRVEVQTGTETRTAHGNVTRTWATVAKRWASIEPLNSREFLLAQQANVDITHKVTMRHYADLTTSQRLKFVDNGSARYLNVMTVLNPAERDRMTVAMCKEDV